MRIEKWQECQPLTEFPFLNSQFSILNSLGTSLALPESRGVRLLRKRLRRTLETLLRLKGRVLVLDDDAAMQRLVALVLQREGYRVDVVSQGRQAIDSLARTHYDAIVLDLMMPHEGGVTVIRHLRERNPELLRRVLLLTAAPERLLHPYAEAVAGVVRKPFEASDLSTAVQRAAAA